MIYTKLVNVFLVEIRGSRREGWGIGTTETPIRARLGVRDKVPVQL